MCKLLSTYIYFKIYTKKVYILQKETIILYICKIMIYNIIKRKYFKIATYVYFRYIVVYLLFNNMPSSTIIFPSPRILYTELYVKCLMFFIIYCF